MAGTTASPVTRITGDDALRALRAVVEGHEEYVYETPDVSTACVYERGGCPSCLVGHALAHLGVPVEALVQMDALDVPSIESVADESPRALGFEMTDNAVAVFAVAQNKQDSGEPWGVAVDAAADALRILRDAEGARS